MDSFVKFAPVREIIGFFSKPGEPCQHNEFVGSCHSQMELLFAIQGVFRYMMNDTVYTVSPGTVVLISPGVNHAHGYRKSDHDLLHLWVFVHENNMYGLIVRIVNGKESVVNTVPKPVVFSRETRQLLLQRWALLEKLGKYDDGCVKQFMKIPLELIENEFDLQQYNLVSSNTDHSISCFLHSYIRNCNGRYCSLRKLAEVTGYSQSHISHVFLKKYGMSIGTFIDKVRQEYVASAFNRHVKQKVIAEELGFSSPKAFWNWKKKFPELQKNEKS